MKKIKTYNLFLESEDNKLWTGVHHEYSIYDWFEDLKSYEWMTNPEGSKVNISSIKMWTNHFIGDGWFEKISNYVDKIFNSFKKVDTDYINDRMYDVYDEFVQGKEKWTMCAVLYGDIEKHSESDKSSGKYSGLVSVPNTSDINKTRIIIHIIKNIIQPTLSIGYNARTGSTQLRQTKDEKYVTEPKYQCSFFYIENFLIYSDIDKPNSFGIMSFDIERKKKYDAKLIMDMYQPGIVINIGGYGDFDNSNKMNLGKLEAKLDEILPSILHDLDYKEVIFDQYRDTRKYSSDTEVHDYTLKILLKI